MLQFPRVCFICYEARQDLLKNCPNCPLVSFCKDHQRSSIHEEDCAKIKMIHEMENGLMEFHEYQFQMSLSSMISHSAFSKQPACTEDFFVRDFEPIPEEHKFYSEQFLCCPLTIFNAFKKLNYLNKTRSSISKIIIHILGTDKQLLAMKNVWEIILHFLPKSIVLKIVLFEQEENTRIFVNLCYKCRLSLFEKILIIECHSINYLEYLRRFGEKPNLVVIRYNLQREDILLENNWKLDLEFLAQQSSLMFTTRSEEDNRILMERLSSNKFLDSRICYNGNNYFAPLYPKREWIEWGVFKNDQFLTVLEAKENAAEERLVKCSKKKMFYPGLCHVCNSPNASVECKQCKMIFYCKESHQKKDFSQHKTICKIILGMLNESGSSNLFDKMKTTDSESWLRVKIDLMKKAKEKIGRELKEFEKQMFLFPKICFVCHESDLSLLGNCECGVRFFNCIIYCSGSLKKNS